MFLIEANLTNKDYTDNIIIGLFSTTEKAIEVTRAWIKEERENESQDDICLFGWKLELDTDKKDRLDFSNDQKCKDLMKSLRQLEKEFPAEQ